MESNKCLECGKELRGRSDKKFCNDYCRNAYNNQLKGSQNNYMRNINNILSKNRRILEKVLPDTEETKKIPKDQLLHQGFIFKYFTHQYITQKGAVYYFVYEYGFLNLDNDWVLIVKRFEPEIK